MPRRPVDRAPRLRAAERRASSLADSAAALLAADDDAPRLSGRGLTDGDILSILPQQLVFGLALGTVYGLIALGYTMVYGVLQMINFAHGEVFMIGAYIGLGRVRATDRLPGRRAASGVGPAGAAAPAMLLCGGARHDAGAPRLSAALHARRNPARPADQRGRRIDLPAERRHAHHGRAHEGLHDQSRVPAHLAVQPSWRQRLGIGDRHGRGVAAA